METIIPEQVLWKLQLKHEVSPATLHKAIMILDTDSLRPTPKGWVVLSNMKEHTEYCVDPSNLRCGCYARQHNIFCSHLLAVLLRIELFNYAKTQMIANNSARKDIISLHDTAKMKPEQSEWAEEID